MIAAQQSQLLLFSSKYAGGFPAMPRSAPPHARHSEPLAGRHRLVVIGCVAKKKAEPAPAKDLYLSTLFAMRRKYAEASGCPWAIVSANYRKIIAPDEIVEPYDRAMSQLKRDELDFWAIDGGFSFWCVFGELSRGCVVEVHAGAAYVEALRSALCRRFGATIETPLAGVGIGNQLAWYSRRGFGARRGTPEATK